MKNQRILCIWFPNWREQEPERTRDGAREKQKKGELKGRLLAPPLLQSLLSFSPVIGMSDQKPCEDLLLDVTGVGDLFGGEDVLAKSVVRHLTRQRYNTRAAIADTIGAAWAVTHVLDHCGEKPDHRGEKPDHPNREDRENNRDSASTLRVIKSRSCQLAIVPSSDLRVLHNLPVATLRLANKTVELLQHLGIFRVEQLLQLPRASLPSRFGDRLLLRLDQMTGRLDELIEPHRPPPEFESIRTLEYPVDTTGIIEHILGELTREVCEQLRQHGQGAMQLNCRLDCMPESYGAVPSSRCLNVGLFRPTAAPDHLLELLAMQLEQMTLPDPVYRFTMEVTQAAPLEERQAELFPSQVQPSHDLTLMINRLSSRLGHDRVVRAHLRADAQPERAFRYVPLTSQSSRRKGTTPPRVSPPGALQRPLRLYRPAFTIQPESMRNDLPAEFVHSGRRYRVVDFWGPERIETGWWRGRTLRRDYYRVETASGSRFWIFRQLDNDRWFLAGAFE